MNTEGEDLRPAVEKCLPKGWRIDRRVDRESMQKLGAAYVVVDATEKKSLEVSAFRAQACAKYGLDKHISRRAAILEESPIPHVQQVSWCQTDEGSRFFIALPEPPRRLDKLKLNVREIDDRHKAAAIIHGILEGLSGLHRVLQKHTPDAPAHGGVRTERIGLSTDGDHPLPILLDVSLGPVPHWTEGETSDPQQKDFLPPDYKSDRMQNADDVYAVGVIWAKLLRVSSRRDPTWRRLDAATRAALRRMLAAKVRRRPTAVEASTLAVAAMEFNGDHGLVETGRRLFRFWTVRLLAAVAVVGTIFALTDLYKVQDPNDELEQKLVASSTRKPGNKKERALDQLISIFYKDTRADVNQMINNLPYETGEGDDIKKQLRTWAHPASKTRKWKIKISKLHAKHTGDRCQVWIDVDSNGVDNTECNCKGSGTLEFEWKSGQPIRILVEGLNSDRAWYNPKRLSDTNLIKHTVEGPLALYRLIYDGVRGDGGRYIHFDFVKDPLGIPLVSDQKKKDLEQNK